MELELFQEILMKVFEKEEIQITFPNLNIDLKDILETESYRVIQKIKSVLEDDRLEDPECLLKIEEIVNIFENIGGDAAGRHNF